MSGQAKDILEKTLEGHDDVFADITNAVCFGGRQAVEPGALADAQPFSLYKMAGDVRGQERDVAKLWKRRRIRICLIGLENQSSPDPNMVYRVLGYDGAAYRWQLAEGGGANCSPVVTLVLYFGTERRWDAPRTLKGRLDIGGREGIPGELDAFVSDYRINVVELAWLTDGEISRFRSDFRAVAEYLRAKRLGVPYEGSRRRLAHAEELLELFRVMSGDGVFDDIRPAILKMAEQKEGGVTMCDVVQAIKREGFSMSQKEVFSLGRSEGFSLGKSEGFSLGKSEGFSLGRTEGVSVGRREGIAIGESQLLSALARLEAAGRPYSLARLRDDAGYRARILAGQDE